MFRKNDRHRQASFLSGLEWLPDKLSQRLRESWAEAFYTEVLCRIDEELFVDLYSDEISWPNAPINVLVGFDILKSGFGWSDEETYEQVCYNLQVRHALGLGDLRSAIFTLWTVYNFRQRVCEHVEEEGINLLQRMFEQVTDTQLAAVQIKTGWQRMDSTQVLSNLAQCSRVGPTLYVTGRAVAVAVQRQRLRPEDASIRAVVEASVREVKHPFAGGKLPVRGLIRARMVIYGSALMVNLRRLHQHFAEKSFPSHTETPVSDVARPFSRLRAWLTHLRHRFASLGRGRVLVSTGV